MKYLFLSLMMLASTSCRPLVPVKGEEPEAVLVDSAFHYIKLEAAQFSLPFEPTVADSNELVFCYRHRFDTSMIVHIKKRKDDIYGIVYLVALPYYQNEAKFAKTIKEPQYFEGFSCYLDSIQWNLMTKEVDTILNIKTALEPNKPFDNPSYALAFNNKARWNISRKDDAMMGRFLVRIKQIFLYDWMARKPKWTREKETP
nr:hypothetical protein [uncultured Chitinophaga sp.]